MARMDVRRGRRTGNLYLEAQSDRFSHLKTRFVIPLVPLDDVPRLSPFLHPILVVGGEALVLATHLAVAAQVGDLGETVATLTDDDAVTRALDTLTGTA